MVKSLICILVTFFILFGCATHTSRPKLPDTKDVEVMIKSIDTAADTIAQQLPEEPVILEQIPVIKSNNANVAKVVAALTEAINKLQKENTDFKDKFASSQKKIVWVITLVSGLAVGVFVMLFFLGKIQSIVPAAISLALFLSALALTIVLTYMLYIAIGCGIILLGMLGYILYRHRNRVGNIIKTVDSAADAGAIDWDKFSEIANKIAEDDPGLKKLIDSYQETKSKVTLNSIKEKVLGIFKRKK